MKTNNQLILVSISLFMCLVGQAKSQTIDWIRQLGSSANDGSAGVAVDGLGNVFITGNTLGNMNGSNQGLYDAFVSRYDSNGNLKWTRQLGSSSDDYSLDVSADGMGNVFIAGRTLGTLDNLNHGFSDAFVSKYDAQGNLKWTRQLGSSDYDGSDSVAFDGLGNVFVSGYTYGSLQGPNQGYSDVFISKYDSDGDLKRINQHGTSSFDFPGKLAADGSGSVYMLGST